MPNLVWTRTVRNWCPRWIQMVTPAPGLELPGNLDVFTTVELEFALRWSNVKILRLPKAELIRLVEEERQLGWRGRGRSIDRFLLKFYTRTLAAVSANRPKKRRRTKRKASRPLRRTTGQSPSHMAQQEAGRSRPRDHAGRWTRSQPSDVGPGLVVLDE